VTDRGDPWLERRSAERKRRSHDQRTPFDRDRARIIHCASFRRLQAKTQVLGISEGDFHRTRLTHSMEVAQISGGLVHRLWRQYAKGNRLFPDLRSHLPGVELMEAIAFSHDLGHPPFGHGGEVALNYLMRDAGGFEGNGQSLRILAKLESHTEGFGLDPTRRTLLGVLKYPVPYETACRLTVPALPTSFRLVRAEDWTPPKCYLASDADVVEWILAPFSAADRARFVELSAPRAAQHGKSRHKALDASIMEMADDIAYGVHDLEDGIALGLIRREHWSKLGFLPREWATRFGLGTIETLRRRLFDDSSATRKRTVGAMVNAFIASVQARRNGAFEHPLLAYNAELAEPARGFLEALKGLTSTHIVKTQPVQTLEYRGRFLVMSLFEALTSDPVRLLKPDGAERYQRADSASAKQRVICDYVAEMTDSYAERMYARLFVPGAGTVFEPL